MVLNSEANNLIQSLQLIPHPEGGYFAPVFKSKDTVQSTDPARYKGEIRSAGTSIYYLLQEDDFSAWHRLDSDEIWHHYKGSPVKIYSIDHFGNLETHLLGDPEKHEGASFQIVIPAGAWFAAKNVKENSFCLIGCTLSPGFEYKDFHLGNRDELVAKFPQHKNMIEKFTRPG